MRSRSRIRTPPRDLLPGGHARRQLLDAVRSAVVAAEAAAPSDVTDTCVLLPGGHARRQLLDAAFVAAEAAAAPSDVTDTCPGCQLLQAELARLRLKYNRALGELMQLQLAASASAPTEVTDAEDVDMGEDIAIADGVHHAPAAPAEAAPPEDVFAALLARWDAPPDDDLQ